MEPDRNLLFLLLALQLDLIDFTQFLDAWPQMRECTAEELGRESGLDPETTASLWVFLTEFVVRYQGSPRAALEAVWREKMLRACDNSPHHLESLERSILLPPPRPFDDLLRNRNYPVGRAGTCLLHQRLGRGGMGQVRSGYDPELGRFVAVKILLAKHRNSKEHRSRFLEEAEIVAQLSHQNIVPLYQRGKLSDGRPYFSMKLVKGPTLADLLEDRPTPATDRFSFVTIFARVCQAVAYAHKHKIIHRDLKPSNVMVPDHNEIYVMDWGLAKVLPKQQDDPQVETLIETSRTRAAGATLAQSVKGGTPGFRAPEQVSTTATGIDPRSDVFGLGAILCVILTGSPPYSELDFSDLADGHARIDQSDADAELKEICKACLAYDRTHRPHDAGDVAERVTAYLSSALEARHREEVLRAAAEARAEQAEARAKAEHRAKRLTRWLALAGAILLLAIIGSGWWAWTSMDRANNAAERAIGEALTLQNQAQADPLGNPAKFQEAVAAARKADELARAGGASAGVRDRAAGLVALLERDEAEARRDRELVLALSEVHRQPEGPTWFNIHQEPLAIAGGPGIDERFAAAFLAWDSGFDLERLSVEEAVARIKRRPPLVVNQIRAAMGDWATAPKFRTNPKIRQKVTALEAALDDAPTLERKELRAILTRGNLPAERGRLRQLAAGIDPASEPVVGILALTRALRLAGDPAAAERLLRAALRSRAGDVVLHLALGQLLRDQEPPRWPEAVECFTAARGLWPGWGEPLAEGLVMSGRAEQGLQLYTHLVTETPENWWRHFKRGNALVRVKRYPEAEEAFRATFKLRATFPEAHNNLAVVLNSCKRYQEAEAECDEALRLRPDYVDAHLNRGIALREQGRLEEAERACRKAIGLEGKNPDGYINLAAVLSARGRYSEAEKSARIAADLAPQRAVAHVNLASALLSQKRDREAEAESREAIKLDPDEAKAYLALGIALTGQLRHEEAVPVLETAVRLEPENAIAHAGLAHALNGLGRHADGLEAARLARKLNPAEPAAHLGMGYALTGLGRFSEAHDSFVEGNKLERKLMRNTESSDAAIRACRRLVELDRKLSAVLRDEAEPADGTEWAELAGLLWRHRRSHCAAARFYTAAFTADPQLAGAMANGYRYNAACAAAITAAGQAEDAKVLPDKVAAMFRWRAQRWLRDELEAYATLAGGNAEQRRLVKQQLEHWMADTDLVSVRSRDALIKLPNEERLRWHNFWDEVTALLASLEVRK